MSLTLEKMSKYFTILVTILTVISIICSGIVYMVRSTAEYTSYLKDLEKNITINRMSLDKHDTRIEVLERDAQVATANIPAHLKESINLPAFTRKSVANNLSDNQFKQAIKTIEESTDPHQASLKLEDSGLFAKADLGEIFSSAILKHEKVQTMSPIPSVPLAKKR